MAKRKVVARPLPLTLPVTIFVWWKTPQIPADFRLEVDFGFSEQEANVSSLTGYNTVLRLRYEGQPFMSGGEIVPKAIISRVAAPLRTQVTDALRVAIVEGEFVPGKRLIEPILCERFEVSRTVVREALRQLETEGLVTMVPNRGPEVATLTIREAESLYEVRGSLEALAGGLFADRATDEECAELQASFEAVKRAIVAGSVRELLSAKDEYYEILLRGSRNGEAARMLRLINARTQVLRGYSLSTEGRGPHTVAELDVITTAAATDRDVQATREACAVHVANAAAAALVKMRAQQ